MRLLAWNIRQGAAPGWRELPMRWRTHKADILVLSEYRGGEAAARLRAALESLGHRHAPLPLVGGEPMPSSMLQD